jgi:molybdopterin molybdotransferase
MAAELELQAAYEALAADVAPRGGAQVLPLAATLGRVLAAELVAPADLPPADLAAMDGYALDSRQAQGALNELAVAGRLLAGQQASAPLGAGQCLRIMTGAPMPSGCDAVAILEDVQVLGGERVRVPGPVPAGLNCRRRGEHVAAGSVVLAQGRVLRSADLALASAIGCDRLPLRPELRVGVVSTGSELRAPPAPLPPGAVYDSNRPMLLAALALPCFATTDLGICPDELGALEQVLERAWREELDAVLISGGAAQGDADHARGLPGVAFQAVRLRPGRGLLHGLLRRGSRELLVLGLPGNAVAAFSLLHLLARPLLMHRAGALAGPPASVPLPLTAPARVRAGRIDLRRARLVQDPALGTAVALLPEQGSAMIRTVAQADALVLLGPEPEAAAGERRPCYLLDALAAG